MPRGSPPSMYATTRVGARSRACVFPFALRHVAGMRSGVRGLGSWFRLWFIDLIDFMSGPFTRETPAWSGAIPFSVREGSTPARGASMGTPRSAARPQIEAPEYTRGDADANMVALLESIPRSTNDACRFDGVSAGYLRR